VSRLVKESGLGQTYADDVPLTLTAKEEQEFAEIVDKSGHLHPFWFAIPSDGFCCLQKMFDLGQLGLEWHCESVHQ